MANRTQIVCLHEGKQGRSIDPVFINRLIRTLNPAWIRPFKGSNFVRPVACGGRSELTGRVAQELKACLNAGGRTTLMVWADLDDDMSNGDQLRAKMWESVQKEGITPQQFESIVFVFAKDRLENWIEYLNEGTTDENIAGPRVKHNRSAADAAKALAERCRQAQSDPSFPPSLEWSCANWRRLVARMKSS